ncbi:MAG: hypothetical protein ACTSPY_01005 [Candidatus Helarchaeota archaeon]
MNDSMNLIIGILLGLIGAAINNFGLVLQKRQVNKKQPPDIKNEGSLDIDIIKFLKDPIWVLGILMQTILYLPFLIIALDYIGVTLLQPLSNSGIIILVLGLIFLLNEKIRKIEIVGIILMVSGVISIAFGNVVGDITLSHFLSPQPLLNFWIFFIIIIILSLIFLILAIKIKRIRLAILGFLMGNCYAIVSISLQLFEISLSELGTAISILVLILGMLGAVIGTIFGILLAQEAFKRGQAINIIPFSQISMNLFPILTGLFVFGQNILSPIYFWIGVISIIISASLLARFQK